MNARKMQVEFERLIQLANNDYVIDNKIDSDTIFYFLNAAQERWIKRNYTNLDNTRNTILNLHKTLDAFKSLIVTTTLVNGHSIDDYDYAKRFYLPSNNNDLFYLYLRSNSKVSGTYMNISGTTEEQNIDTNASLPLYLKNSISIAPTVLSTTLPSYIVPTSTDGPIAYGSLHKIYFSYGDSLYSSWKLNSVYKSNTSYISSNNTPLVGTIYSCDSIYYEYTNAGLFSLITITTTSTPKLVNVPNKLITLDEIDKVMVSYFNQPILRLPCAVLDADTDKNTYITIYHDSYTTIYNCSLTYIRKPKKFDVIVPTDDDSIVDTCELSENVHQEIVELSVDMFITEGAYRLNAKLSNNQQQDQNNQ